MAQVDNHLDGWLEKPCNLCAFKTVGIDSRYKQLARLIWYITK